MTFRQMELFVDVCENGSITNASRHSHVSPQGISRTIRQLEEELGSELITRTHSGISVTPRGSFFYEECRRVLKWKTDIPLVLDRCEDNPPETIDLGMAFGMITTLPGKLFSSFEALHPGVKIRYEDNTDLALEAQLRQGDFSFCLSTGVLDADRFIKRVLIREPVMLCIPRNHGLYEKREINMEDLDGQHFVMFSTQFFIRHRFDSVCGEAGVWSVIDYISNDFNSLLGLAQQNDLLFTVPRHCVSSLGEQCRYTQFPDERFEWDVCMIRERHPELTGTAAIFWDYLEKTIPGQMP